MTVSIIAILSANDVIGLDNRLPWHMPADLKRFKSLTMGHHVIMGRKTFQSMGKPLPGRITAVVTRDAGFSPEGVAVARSVEEAISKAEAAGDEEIFIAGGAEIFAQTLHRADRMYLTRIHSEFEGDTFFPEFDDVAEWKLVDAEHLESDEKNAWPYSFLTYEREWSAGEPARAPC
ncbi:MAG TPA: dihydrofolate reductase [Thermoanaerobaculia bacterium]|nr:dihydrofolate reductase [Thermoanaerobaculia bacterium]